MNVSSYYRRNILNERDSQIINGTLAIEIDQVFFHEEVLMLNLTVCS